MNRACIQAAGLLIALSTGVLIPTVRATAGDGPETEVSETSDIKVPGSDNRRYSEQVVKKAEAFLAEANLRRSGSSILSERAGKIARKISGLSRRRRELGLKQQAVHEAERQLAGINQRIAGLKQRDGNLNLQMARRAGNDVTANNRLVAMINATRSAIEQLSPPKRQAQAEIVKRRGELIDAESAYAEEVFSLRQEFDELRQQVSEDLGKKNVQIALQVMSANHNVPENLDAAAILRPVESRLREVESEVFQESIQLDAQPGGSLYLNVSINNQSARMVLDSGATLVTLPNPLATKLQVTIPPEAPRLRLVLANGQEISARAVTLDRVRVGQFEATDVRAAVLEAGATDAQPLLGMSYLSRFKFEIDPAAGTLSMLRVAEEK